MMTVSLRLSLLVALHLHFCLVVGCSDRPDAPAKPAHSTTNTQEKVVESPSSTESNAPAKPTNSGTNTHEEVVKSSNSTDYEETSHISSKEADQVVHNHILAVEQFREDSRISSRKVRGAFWSAAADRDVGSANTTVEADIAAIVRIHQTLGEVGDAKAAEYLGVAVAGFGNHGNLKTSAGQAIADIKKRLGPRIKVAEPDAVREELKVFMTTHAGPIAEAIRDFHEAYRGYPTRFYQSGAIANELMDLESASKAGALTWANYAAIVERLRKSTKGMNEASVVPAYPHARIFKSEVNEMMALLEQALGAWNEMADAGMFQGQRLATARDQRLMVACERGDQAMKAFLAINKILAP